jgi:hypothetical protein
MPGNQAAIAKLETLLSRVQARAKQPRTGPDTSIDGEAISIEPRFIEPLAAKAAAAPAAAPIAKAPPAVPVRAVPPAVPQAAPIAAASPRVSPVPAAPPVVRPPTPAPPPAAVAAIAAAVRPVYTEPEVIRPELGTGDAAYFVGELFTGSFGELLDATMTLS